MASVEAVSNLSTPVTRVGDQVERLARQFVDGRTDAVYVSTPITTGREYFRLLRMNGVVPEPDRARLRLRNATHAKRVIESVKDAYAGRVVIEPVGFDEPAGWGQDQFNAFWMLVIHYSVQTVVVVDGWEYSTGCTWELSQALHDRLTVFDERLERLPVSVMWSRLEEAERIVGRQSTWANAKDAATSELLLSGGGIPQ